MSKNSTALLLLASLALPTGAFAQSFDLVIAGGRVMDPETGFDNAAFKPHDPLAIKTE